MKETDLRTHTLLEVNKRDSRFEFELEANGEYHKYVIYFADFDMETKKVKPNKETYKRAQEKIKKTFNCNIEDLDSLEPGLEIELYSTPEKEAAYDELLATFDKFDSSSIDKIFKGEVLTVKLKDNEIEVAVKLDGVDGTYRLAGYGLAKYNVATGKWLKTQEQYNRGTFNFKKDFGLSPEDDLQVIVGEKVTVQVKAAGKTVYIKMIEL